MAKVKKSTENTKVLEKEQESPWYYFYSIGCAFCKKSEPIIDELIKDGHDILKLDISNPENKKIADELKKEYNVQCGTPWFINADTGKGICGFREKDVLEKWLDGEDIPAPPRPTGPMPRPPFHGATGKQEADWKKEYKKWATENSHLPKLQTAKEILERPRPKSEPPRPPMGQGITDKQYEDWGKEWDKWKEDNKHLPNLQPSKQMIENFKQRNQQMSQQQMSQQQQAPNMQGFDQRINNLEQKLDKLMSHLGVK